MKGLLPLFLGIFGTFAFSWTGLVFVPNLQIGHLDPQTDEEGGDAYPKPRSGLAERGRQIYAANGCMYCHSQQVRSEFAASDIDRKWGERRSAPRDYIFDRPVLLGKMRMGPDLANVGHRVPVTDEAAAPAPPAGSPAPPAAGAPPASPAPGTSPAAATAPSAAPVAAAGSPPASPSPVAPAPAISPAPASTTTSAPPATAETATLAASPTATDQTTVVGGGPIPYSAAWHHRHLYDPRGITLDSNMPAYRFLYEKRRIAAQPSAEALVFDAASTNAPPAGWEIVPSYEAKCLVAYLMSLDQTHPLKEVKSTAPVSPPAPGQQAK
jgi:cbb3-type cytochrome oxidase cytochrome c subunit